MIPYKTIGRLLLLSSLLSPCVYADDSIVNGREGSQSLHRVSPKRKPIYNAAYFNKNFRFYVTFDKDKGRIVKIVYKRITDNKIFSEAYPYGREDYGTNHIEKKYNRQGFRKLMATRLAKLKKANPSRPRSFSKVANVASVTANSGSSTNTTGMGIGYNPSTGYLGASTCYNFTTTYSTAYGSETFTSQNSASSVASQTNVSADINGSYGAFSANDSFSYENSYSNSANSGQIYFNAAQVYIATNTLNSDGTDTITATTALNSTGNQALQAGTFSQQCGSYILSAVPVGMLITGQFTWASSDSSSSNQIKDGVTGTSAPGLDSISTAVSSATQSSTVSNSFSFTTTINGGDENALTSWYNCTGVSQTQTDLAECMDGTSSSCESFASAYNTCATNALGANNSDFNKDQSNGAALAVFPYGVAGVTTNLSQSQVQSLSNIIGSSATDPFSSSMASALSNYVNILNQLQTLINRLNYLESALNKDNFDPAPNLPIANTYIAPLLDTSTPGSYAYDANNFKTTLGNCLSDPGSDDCTTIANLYNGGKGTTNVYQWYSGENSGITSQNQNTIALQYTGTTYYTGYWNMSYPVDVMWAYALPATWQVSPAPYGYNPAGLPALMAFADAPYLFGGQMYNGAWATLYAQDSGYGMTSNTSLWKQISATTNTAGWYSDTGTNNSPAIAGDSSSCTAFTYNSPCTFSSTLTTTGSKPYTLSVDLSVIPNFFGSQTTIDLN